MQLENDGGWGAKWGGYFAPPAAVAVVNHCNYNSSNNNKKKKEWKQNNDNNNIVNFNWVTWPIDAYTLLLVERVRIGVLGGRFFCGKGEGGMFHIDGVCRLLER